VQRLANTLTIESVSVHRALRGVPHSGGTLLEVVGSSVGGVSRRREEIASSGTGSERAQGRERILRGPPGIQRSVAEEAVHREGRCAAPGEAPDRGVPAAVR
jgi:hypothetical protein